MIQSRESALEQFKETLGEKMMAAKLLLRIQRTYEERELRLRRHLSEEDIERLVSDQNPIKDAASIDAKYLNALCEQTLRSFSVNRTSLVRPF